MVALLSAPAALAGQVGDGVVEIQGRVEDASTRLAVEGVRIASADSTAFAVTDSLGNFTLRVQRGGPWAVFADRLGYLAQRFDLGGPGEARYVLLLEPAPIVIEALTVEAEAALGRLVRNLAARRNAYPHAMRALDRTWIDRFGPVGGSAMDIVLQAVPQIFECSGDASALCVRSRFVTLRDPWPEDQIRVCIDGLLSYAPASELFSIDAGSLALVEIYQRRHVRVYTQAHLLNRARRGWTAVEPVDLPIPGC